ncbi:sulfurtransferase [Mariniflexile ostreae]|uniref:Sulfurtransferase n=1 Tax=Mariniflexile ostreae TaxID=1520892 RepID=A0ABV5FDN4_9FLAO
MSAISIKTPIVSVEWLYKHLDAENLIVLDGTIIKNLEDSPNQIPNARFFDIKKKFSDITNSFPSAFPSEKQFQKEAQALGIHTDSAIVVYDDKGIYSSARVWWMFKAMGHENVAVLNGGFPEWQKAAYPSEKPKLSLIEVGDFVAHYQPKSMRFFEDMKEATKNSTQSIIDARSKDRFLSLVDEPKEGLRRGQIPNSINLPFTDLMDGNKLKDTEGLEPIFKALVKKKSDIIFSCGSGITACILALAADILGYKNIAVYDGSWTEWGSLVDPD